MGYGVRYYVANDMEIKRLTTPRARLLFDGILRVPYLPIEGYPEPPMRREQKMVEVTLKYENRQMIGVTRVLAFKLFTNDDGLYDKPRNMQRAVATIGIDDPIAKLEHQMNYLWSPTTRQLLAIGIDIGIGYRPMKDILEYLKGKVNQ